MRTDFFLEDFFLFFYFLMSEQRDMLLTIHVFHGLLSPLLMMKGHAISHFYLLPFSHWGPQDHCSRL